MRILVLFLFAFSLAVGLPATAFDLTGHWEGSWSCTVYSNGVKSKDEQKESTFDVTSLGNGRFGGIFDGNYEVRGIELTDAAKPEKGEIAFVSCGGDDDLSNFENTELGRLKVSTSGSEGTLSGTSVWSSGPGHIATCKYKHKRMNTNNPGLTYTCP